ncbi:hypothetical protein DHD80_18260 [Gramella sp. AN32]|nr:hypothetical protein [Gramella sp. AN32]
MLMGKITFLLFLIISIPKSYSQCTTTPTVNISANTETICEGEEVLFQSSITGGNEWEASYQKFSIFMNNFNFINLLHQSMSFS